MERHGNASVDHPCEPNVPVERLVQRALLLTTKHYLFRHDVPHKKMKGLLFCTYTDNCFFCYTFQKRVCALRFLPSDYHQGLTTHAELQVVTYRKPANPLLPCLLDHQTLQSLSKRLLLK
ncbi:hypothetical protein CEXT_224861 [Caerostris extrusa]|uniref:Uncharacterized protein n=1 Tax=Caerostris extrusa TaxID=172846 RepID=A0AAV4WT27_CAEEX|nr:hypothetical protein CEXT_224861 [Caerostris extrusa]